MALPTPDDVLAVEERFGSWEKAEDEAERRPKMDSAHIWGRDMTYAERVWTVLRPDFADSTAEEPADETSLRHPLPVLATTRVLEMRLVDKLSWPEIEKKVDLSHRKVDYIRKAILHEDLGWDEAGNCPAFGPLTRNTAAGIVLPRH